MRSIYIIFLVIISVLGQNVTTPKLPPHENCESEIGYGCHFHCPAETIPVYDSRCRLPHLTCCYFPQGPCTGSNLVCKRRCPGHWPGTEPKSCPYYRPNCCIRSKTGYEGRRQRVQLRGADLKKAFPFATG